MDRHLISTQGQVRLTKDLEHFLFRSHCSSSWQQDFIPIPQLALGWSGHAISSSYEARASRTTEALQDILLLLLRKAWHRSELIHTLPYCTTHSGATYSIARHLPQVHILCLSSHYAEENGGERPQVRCACCRIPPQRQLDHRRTVIGQYIAYHEHWNMLYCPRSDAVAELLPSHNTCRGHAIDKKV